MLHLETIDSRTLELILRLNQDVIFQKFILVGGTGLALQLGHRTSVDIDLFSQDSFDTGYYLEHLERSYGFELQFAHKDTLKGFIDGVLIDILTHPYPFVGKVIDQQGIRLASMQDIAALKLNAIAIDGTRLKDFVDLYFLLKRFSLKQMMGFYEFKYSQRNVFHVVKSLTYFNEVDTKTWPVMMLEQDMDMGSIISSIRMAVNQYITEGAH